MSNKDGVLPVFSLIVSVLAFFAGCVLIYASMRLASDFGLPQVSRTQTYIGMVVVVGLAGLCFFEAYRFGAFWISPRIRSRYYARFRLRRMKELKAKS